MKKILLWIGVPLVLRLCGLGMYRAAWTSDSHSTKGD